MTARSLMTCAAAGLLACTLAIAPGPQFHGRAMAQTADAAPDRDAAALARLTAAAEAGDPVAMADVARFHENGWGGLEADDNAALVWLQRAAEAGDGWAAMRIGIYHHNGRGGLAADREEALRWFQIAADRGDPWGMFNVGVYHENGWGGLNISYATALEWYRPAADAGVNVAMAKMGEFLESGWGGLDRDLEAALDWRQRAVAAGHSQSGLSVTRLTSMVRQDRLMPQLLCLVSVDATIQGLTLEMEVIESLPRLVAYASPPRRAALDAVAAEVRGEIEAATAARARYADLEGDIDYRVRDRLADFPAEARTACLNPAQDQD